MSCFGLQYNSCGLSKLFLYIAVRCIYNLFYRGVGIDWKVGEALGRDRKVGGDLLE